jgi:hypothetical protein
MRRSRTDFFASPPFLRLFFVFFERERKAGTALFSLCDAVRNTSEAGKQHFMEESPPRAQGEKMLPPRAKIEIEV